MSFYVCLDCPLTKSNLGEWNSEHPFFKNVKLVHSKHKGFGEGVIPDTVMDLATKYMKENYDKLLHIVINSCKSPKKSYLFLGVFE